MLAGTQPTSTRVTPGAVTTWRANSGYEAAERDAARPADV
jgi:hypothetical protein